MLSSFRKLKVIIVISVTLFLGSCTEDFDINTAQRFGSFAEPFEDQYEDIVKDIYQSCKRNARYRGAIRFRQGRTNRQALESRCLGIAYNQKSLLMAHEVLARYTSAFRELSSDELIAELDGAGNLATALLALPFPGSTEIQPIINTLPIAQLANSIQRAIAERKRRKVLRKAIFDVNTNIQLYIAELSRITQEQYYLSLVTEELGMNIYFSRVISQELDKEDCIPSSDNKCQTLPIQVSVIEADKLWQDERESRNFPELYNRLNSYLRTLKNMANTHQELYNSVADFDD